jgi:general stress protein 26
MNPTSDRKSLSEIAGRMRDIDVAMLSTHTEDGRIGSRPMSNNRDVEYDGKSYYFTWDGSRMVSDIEADPNVSLAFQGKDGFFVAVEGRAEVSRDKERFREHWQPEFDEWFEDGIDTKGVAMIEVHAERATYWDGMKEGEVRL